MMSFSRSMAREEQCRFGIPTLDESIGGGVPRGSIILVEDEVGVNSDPFLIQFLAEGLASGEYGYIMGTEHMYDHYRSLLVPFGIDEIVVETRRLIYLDAFTNPFGSKEQMSLRGPQNVIRDLMQPRHVTDTLAQSLLHVQNAPVRGVIDSLSTIILVADDYRAPLSLFHHKIATDKKNRYVTLFTLHSDVHDMKVVKMFEHYADIVFRLSRDQQNNSIFEIIKVEGKAVKVSKYLIKSAPGKIELQPLA